MTFAEAMRILAAFERHGVAYVLVGSMAMAAQGIVRATRDIDVFVRADEVNIARLRAALREVFDDPEIDRISAADLAGDYPAIQYVPPAGDYWIDILARLGEAVRYADLESDVVQIEGTAIRVATPRTLYRMKRDTVRPQDHADAQLLKQRFNIEDP
ncbi:MAG TPA: nucleotidyl transferase AbiEii/AbiGii toxin family protein [Vicinamibacterales bacterium]|nr:nucleotidyl transferase AbiEii/AbiGii toxin family protein [Vicinamibacterales bacterium]